MKGDPLPGKDHVARYCGGATKNLDGSISGTALRLKEKAGRPEEYLSVNWLEYLNKETREAEIQEVRNTLVRKGRTLGAEARIAVLSVGRLKSHVRENSEDERDLKVLHEPEPNDPSHSGIHGFGMDEDMIADLLAQTIQEIHSARISNF